jgi:NitT/TauT family transport system substrate-binding protein
VKPTLRHHGASEGLFTALAAGQEQFVIAGGDELMQARSGGLDLVAVASYYRSYPVVVIVPADSAITTLADLKGHSIGVPGKYGENWFGLQVALRTAGLTEADVTVQEIGYTQQAALTTKKVDAIVAFNNNEAVQFAQAGFAARSLPIAEGTVPLVGICLITTTAYAKDNPATVRAVAAGMLAGITSVVADPDRALTVSADYVPGLTGATAQPAAKATLTATLPLWTTSAGSVDGHLDAAQWASMADFMAAKGLTPSLLQRVPRLELL